jgi:hypothetical protein
MGFLGFKSKEDKEKEQRLEDWKKENALFAAKNAQIRGLQKVIDQQNESISSLNEQLREMQKVMVRYSKLSTEDRMITLAEKFLPDVLPKLFSKKSKIIDAEEQTSKPSKKEEETQTNLITSPIKGNDQVMMSDEELKEGLEKIPAFYRSELKDSFQHFKKKVSPYYPDLNDPTLERAYQLLLTI